MIDGEAVEFGTSGKLYNSNLVMYDRKTDTYWSQIDGLAILGELAGAKLTQLSVDTVVWRDWKGGNSNAEVLSKDTGYPSYLERYGRDPYGSYYEDSFLFFQPDNQDNRVHPKTVIFGVEVNGAFAAYMEDDLIASGSIEDTVGGVDILVARDESGVVTVTDRATGEEIVKERGFWFSWYAFHPETTLYGR